MVGQFRRAGDDEQSDGGTTNASSTDAESVTPADRADGASDELEKHTRRAGLTRVGRRAVIGGVVVGLAGCSLPSDETTPSCATAGGTTASGESLGPAMMGKGSARVTVRVWEDLSSARCRTFSQTVFPRLREEYIRPGEVRYVRYDFPKPVRDWAWAAASGARAVQANRGVESHLRFIRLLYDRQSEYDPATLTAVADEVGADECAVLTAAQSQRYRPVVEADKQRGIDRGVSRLPGVFVGGTPVAFGDEIQYQPVRATIERQT